MLKKLLKKVGDNVEVSKGQVSDKILLDVEDVQKLLGIKKDRAYMVMRNCNAKLAQMGKLTLKGRVNREFLLSELNVRGG